MTGEENDFLDAPNRASLLELVSAPDIEQVWTRIERICGKQPFVLMRLFIREVLVARRLAAYVEDWPDYLQYAEKADSLANFLMGATRLPPPLPMNGSSTGVAFLQAIALELRKRANLRMVRKSREDVNGSRQYTLFMGLMGLQMQEFFGHWFDNEVAYLTNIFFRRQKRQLILCARDGDRGPRRSV